MGFVDRITSIDVARTRRWIIGLACLVAGVGIAAAPGATAADSWHPILTVATPTVIGVVLAVSGVLILLPGTITRMIGTGLAALAHVFFSAAFIDYAIGHKWQGIFGACETAAVAAAALFMLFELTKATTLTARTR